MTARKDYYAALGVPRDAAQDDIKRAYRKLARKLHPDVNPDDATAESRFKEVAEAYHVLGDPERRKTYDQVGPEGFAQQFDMSDFGERLGSFFGAQPRGGGFGFDAFEELLRGGFGRQAGPGRGRFDRGGAPPGQDIQVPLRLTLEQALSGGDRQVSYRLPSGETRRVRARVPAGVRDGARIRLRGKGASAGGPPGDLYLQVELVPHPRLRLQGDDLLVDVPIAVYEAALGGTIDVPTLDGTSRINLPPGTRGGQVFRLRGKGAPGPRGTGDLLARVVIVLPEPLPDDVAALMTRLRDEHPYDPRKRPDDQD